MSDEFDPVEAIREAARLLETANTFGYGFAHNADRWVAAMLRGADQLEAARGEGAMLRHAATAVENLRGQVGAQTNWATWIAPHLNALAERLDAPGAGE